MSTAEPRRILVIDDNPAIHADFVKILGVPETRNQGLLDAKAAFFGATAKKPVEEPYAIDAASQGREALEMVKKALAEKRPYALAFVDVRMPPGWDGVETIAHLWEADPDLQCVICTAFADYSWDEMIARLGRSDRLLILKKPFDPIEACQIAASMTEKWLSTRRERARLVEVQRAEEEARAYSASLMTMNRALEAARSRAEAALAAKSECLASLGQEIRTPLQAILDYAEVLHGAHVPEHRRREHAGQIQDHGEALMRTLSNLIDLAHIETRTLATVRATVAPMELVHDVLRAHSAQARGKSIRTEAACRGPIPATIQTDPGRLRQVLHHLVENAIKFTDSGTVRVELCLEDPGTEDPRLSFAVRDTGAGIRPEQQVRLFEAFNGPDAQFIREQGGAGLGLVISKHLAQLLGGDLAVESAPGSGSVFTCTVKTGSLSAVQLIDYPPAPIPWEPCNGEPEELPDLHGRRVLLVEDVPTTQKLFRAFLESCGAEVVAAENGRAGIDQALEAERQGRAFDVILMDIQMPIVDGHAATRELRKAGCQSRIVAVTAQALAGDREKCLASGCDDYAEKPLGRRALAQLCAPTRALDTGPSHWPRRTRA
jgi:signal transduction histidine kinase